MGPLSLGIVYGDALNAGGYPRDVQWLAASLVQAGAEVHLFCEAVSRSHNGKVAGPLGEVQVHQLSAFGGMAGRLDLVHVFGLFAISSALAGAWTALRGRPLVVSSAAHLMPHAIRVKSWKKRPWMAIAWRLWHSHVTAVHVFSALEGRFVRPYFPGSAVFSAPLGLYPVPLRRTLSSSVGPLQLLYLGRNDVYQKGLDILIDGIFWAKKLGVSCQLVIAGEPWRGSVESLRARIATFRLADVVTLLGRVDETAKWQLLSDADYLIYLSRWDGPPRPIREALGVGTPVIITEETNMADLVRGFGAGAVVPLDGLALAYALQDLAARALWMRYAQGVACLQKRLQWHRVAEDYLTAYQSFLDSI